MSRLRVLFITASYPTPEAPVEAVFVREHARAAALRHEVVVVHGPRLAKGVTWRLEEQRDPAVCEGVRTFDLFFGASPIPKTHWLMYLHAAARVHEGLLGHGFVPDIVHANLYKAGIPGAVIAKLADVPMVLTEHLSDLPRRLLSPRQQLEAKTAYAAAAIAMPVSVALLDGINGYGIYPRHEIVPNAVDTGLFFPAPVPVPVPVPAPAPKARRKQTRLLFVGGLVPVKGVDNLLLACARLQKRRRDWTLEVVGDGPLRGTYERLVSELGLEKRVRLTGALLKPEVASRMQAAEVLVVPSLWDNLPCVALEGMCCGLPIVACRVGGIPEVVGPEQGILCEPRDPGALAAALEEMLEGRGAFDRAAISARAAARFGYEAVSAQLDRVYHEAIALTEARR